MGVAPEPELGRRAAGGSAPHNQPDTGEVMFFNARLKNKM